MSDADKKSSDEIAIGKELNSKLRYLEESGIVKFMAFWQAITDQVLGNLHWIYDDPTTPVPKKYCRGLRIW